MEELLRYIDEMERRLACLEGAIAREHNIKLWLEQQLRQSQEDAEGLQRQLRQSQEDAEDLQKQLADQAEELPALQEPVAPMPTRRKKNKKTPDPNQLMLPFEDWP